MFTHYYNSPIGLIEIIGNDAYISSIMFVEEKKEESTSIPKILKNCVTQLNEYFSGTRREFDIPHQQKGTDFQTKTWDYICQIPYGKTDTYLKIAHKHWDNKAIRAVGGAVGKNKLSIVVPCHRVVGTNGDLTGYSGGLWRKEWMLNHEQKIAFGTQELFG